MVKHKEQKVQLDNQTMIRKPFNILYSTIIHSTINNRGPGNERWPNFSKKLNIIHPYK